MNSRSAIMAPTNSTALECSLREVPSLLNFVNKGSENPIIIDCNGESDFNCLGSGKSPTKPLRTGEETLESGLSPEFPK